MNRKTLGERLWPKVDVGHPRDCWLWQGAMFKQGYGDLGRWRDEHGVQHRLKAHRVSWELCNGPIPEGLGVLHRCDTPACVNPYHLFVGTQKVNLDDMRAKGRDIRGEAHVRAKLTEDDVRAIRSSPDAQGDLAHRYGISRGYVSLIQTGRRWKHLGGESVAAR